jgi:hypothetical protein
MPVRTEESHVPQRYRGDLAGVARRRCWRQALHLLLVVGLFLQTTGCTRVFYRRQADEEVSSILANKDKYPAWRIENWHVYADPRARFADPSNPDRPPKPPDDPAAYTLSPNPQHPGKAGIARIEGSGYLELIAQWDRENRDRKAREDAEEQKKTEPPKAEEMAADKEIPFRRLDLLPVHYSPKPGEGTSGAETISRQAPAPGDAPAPPKPPATGPTPDASATRTRAPDPIAQAKEPSLLDIAKQTTYLLTLDQAAELAMFNSREYQDQRENLYIAALPVTQERFALSTQTLIAGEAIREYSGRKTLAGQSSNWSFNNGLGLAKVLPTGALLLFNLANQTVVDFINPKKTLSVTTLNFDAIQPLLRGAGQAVTLEGLTQAERNLLYAIRSFARFRKELYVAIASSSGGSISGAAFQPTGVLSSTSGISSGGLGVSGLTPGLIPRVTTSLSDPVVNPRNPGVVNLSGAITPQAAGYLNTMLQKIQIYIDQENIDVLSGILQRFRGLLEGDVVGPLQVQSVEQQLLSGRATLLLDQQQYLQSINAFKIEIGVPMQLSIETDDSVLQPLLKQFRRARAITENEQAAVAEASTLIDLEKAPKMRAELLRLFQNSTLTKGTSFSRSIRERWGQWESLTNKGLEDRLEQLRKEAQKLLDLQADLQKKGETLSPADQARLKEVNSQRDLGNFERSLRQYEAAYTENGKPKKPDAAGERQRIRQFQTVLSAWQKVLVVARDEQWDAVRTSWPELPRCCVDGVNLITDDLIRAEDAAQRHALVNRFDLMNVRAQLVDTWRQIKIFANALLGSFTVRYHLQSNSPLNAAQPLNIGGSGNLHELILDWRLPLVRLQERNNYRASLIAFQRQRRTLQEAEDLAVQAVRNEIYALRQYSESYNVQKRQLELAYLTIDSSLESLQAPTAPPPPPGIPASRAGADGPAALTTQLLNAQRSLPTAQNNLLTIWINYLNTRLQLYRDLELMPLDQRGVWIDEVRDCDCGIGLDQPAKPDTPEKGPESLPEPKRLSLEPGGGAK